MNFKTLTLCAIVCTALTAACCSGNRPDDYTQYVNQYIGTGGFGNCYLGAALPFGMTTPGPTEHGRLPHGGEWCSGYNYSDSLMMGFGQIHLSGTGCGARGDIVLLPTYEASRQHDAKFSHDHEIARPGYYSVVLDGSGIRAEITATPRTSFYRYTYPSEKDTAKVIIDLYQSVADSLYNLGESRSDYLHTSLVQESETTFTGYRIADGWSVDRRFYFVLEFSQPVSGVEKLDSDVSALSFTDLNKPLLAKMALSPVSIDNARENLAAENALWDFDEVTAKASEAWNDELGRISVKASDPGDKAKFYTALYHTMIHPSLYQDVNGDYRRNRVQWETRENAIFRDTSFTNYTVLSLWDSYRVWQPLASLIYPEMQHDLAMTMLNICEQQGMLPIWHLDSIDNFCMIGFPSAIHLADMVLKGYVTDTTEIRRIYEGIRTSLMRDDRELDLLKKYGYLPYDKIFRWHESVAKTLEYAVADASCARVARLLGDGEGYEYFWNRSQSYRHNFDPQTGFMRGLSSDGKFREPFDPSLAPRDSSDYAEGNAWQWSWLVPHDVHGLMEVHGGEKAFSARLDSLFTTGGYVAVEGSTIDDPAKLVGQYNPGNEPDHHVIFLYNYAGEQWKSAYWSRYIMKNRYFNRPYGLCGNEDAGAMSAWFVMSAIGLFQVDPAGGPYCIGSPLFDEVTLRVRDGKTFKIVAKDNSDENIYIQSARLNGQPYTKSYLTFEDLAAGGTIEYQMGPTPSAFGSAPSDRP